MTDAYAEAGVSIESADKAVELPEPELLGKHLLEGIEVLEKGLRDAENPTPTLDVDGLPTLLGGGGAADAMTRP